MAEERLQDIAAPNSLVFYLAAKIADNALEAAKEADAALDGSEHLLESQDLGSGLFYDGADTFMVSLSLQAMYNILDGLLQSASQIYSIRPREHLAGSRVRKQSLIVSPTGFDLGEMTRNVSMLGSEHAAFALSLSQELVCGTQITTTPFTGSSKIYVCTSLCGQEFNVTHRKT
ncbi:hypothetical protein L207DRAFT_582788 [Hyaloscypha variabilis F]|uniref:Uncharacterized protein n=1 Tax=Hyaloscypha variabilis (strain UAMH 11265 / GT02V1 / F) TaxID=1149755 RepID=A0A2J6RQ19_HYAVF|nr:hypothetical protein L207DRAFT_582788 [Hyaloscypha variabilis F]